MTKKEATKRWRRCREPGAGPITPLPRKGADRLDFEEYNDEALSLFLEHADNCLWCRTTNKAAMDALRRAEEEARRKAAEEEARRLAEEEARKRAAEEEARRLAEEEARRRAAEEESARRRAEEVEADRKRAQDEEAARRRAMEEEARRLAEEALRRGLQAETARRVAMEEEEARRRQVEDEAARLAEEIAEAERRRLRLLALGKKKYLRRGEGTNAASQAARLQGDKDREEKAKRDIADFSISHAKKGGLVSSKPEFNGSTSEQAAAKMVFVEMDAVMDENWDQEWDREQYERFESMRAGMEGNSAAVTLHEA